MRARFLAKCNSHFNHEDDFFQKKQVNRWGGDPFPDQLWAEFYSQTVIFSLFSAGNMVYAHAKVGPQARTQRMRARATYVFAVITHKNSKNRRILRPSVGTSRDLGIVVK